MSPGDIEGPGFFRFRDLLSLSLSLPGSGVREDHSEAICGPAAEEEPGAAVQALRPGLGRVRPLPTGGPQETARGREEGFCSAHKMRPVWRNTSFGMLGHTKAD